MVTSNKESGIEIGSVIRFSFLKAQAQKQIYLRENSTMFPTRTSQPTHQLKTALSQLNFPPLITSFLSAATSHPKLKEK